MRIELTDEEVIKIGRSRHKPPKYYIVLIPGIVALVFTLVLMFFKTPIPYVATALFFGGALSFFHLGLELKSYRAAGQRFLEEQKAIQWETLPHRQTLPPLSTGIIKEDRENPEV